jgi:hypothetical protein
VSNVISDIDITENPKAMAKAGEVWSQIEKLRQEYQSMLDIAFDTMCGDEGLAEAMVDDEKHWHWLARIETKLEEKGRNRSTTKHTTANNDNQK